MERVHDELQDHRVDARAEEAGLRRRGNELAGADGADRGHFGLP